jgi:hypothetical protein
MPPAAGVAAVGDPADAGDVVGVAELDDGAPSDPPPGASDDAAGRGDAHAEALAPSTKATRAPSDTRSGELATAVENRATRTRRTIV